MLSTLVNPLPYHILAYGTCLGTQLYQVIITPLKKKQNHRYTELADANQKFVQSFINTKICYQSLSPQSFNNLNRRLFPVYFRCQLGLAVVTFVTKPPGVWLQIPSASDPGNWLLDLAIVMAGLNWYVYGPRTGEAMIEKATAISSSQLSMQRIAL